MNKVIAATLLLLLAVGCRRASSSSESQVESIVSLADGNSGNDALAPVQTVTLESVRNLVAAKLKRHDPNSDPLHSYEGYCLDFSAVWLQILNESGIKAALQQTHGVYYPKVLGKSVQRSPTHFFVAINPGSAGEIILDPTYGQFIAGAERLNLTPILIAERDEVIRVYRRYVRSLRLNVFFDEHMGLYDPREVAEMIYSFGRYSSSRSSLEP